jgi:hypothetical protein
METPRHKTVVAWLLSLVGVVLMIPGLLLASVVFSFDDSGSITNWQALLVSLPFLICLALFVSSVAFLSTHRLWLWRTSLGLFVVIAVTPIVLVVFAVLSRAYF